MKKICIVSKEHNAVEELEALLKTQYTVYHWGDKCTSVDKPNLFLVTDAFSFTDIFSDMKDYLGQVPVLFIRDNEDSLHVLTCSELQHASCKSIERNACSLLEHIAASLHNTSENENNQGLSEIQSDIHKSYSDSCGALQVEYDGFTSIYHFVEKLAERSGQCVQTLLLTLMPRSGIIPTEEQVETAMMQLSQAVQMTLRKNDVITGCGNAQMLVLLMDADDDGGHLAANRIFNAFLGLYDDDVYDLHYDIKPIGTHA